MLLEENQACTPEREGPPPKGLTNASDLTSVGSPESLLRLRVSPIKNKLIVRPNSAGTSAGEESAAESADGGDSARGLSRGSSGGSSGGPTSVVPGARRPPPKILRGIGRLASIACGAAELRDLLPRYSGLRKWLEHPVAGTLIHITCHMVLRLLFGVVSLLMTVAVLPALVVDEFHLCYFWARSIGASHTSFLVEGAEVRKIVQERNDKFQKMKYVNDRAIKPGFAGATCLSDTAFTLYTGLLELARNRRGLVPMAIPRSPIRLMKLLYKNLKSRVAEFREYLSYREPDFPISANDDVYRYDREGNRFQLLMLFVMDRTDFSEFKQTYQRRWIDWETKTRAVVGRRYGRPAWQVIKHEEFDAGRHIMYKSVDLTKTTITDVVSALADEEMPRNQPQWQVWFVQPEETAKTIRMSFCDNRDVSKLCFICCKWNHIYSDGAGMMMSIVKRIGDHPVSVQTLPGQYRRVVPRWLQVTYYTLHSFRAAFECSQHLLYFLLGIPSYPAIMVPNSQTDRKAPPGPNTGHKHYSAPAVMSIPRMTRLREAIAASGREMLNLEKEGAAARQEGGAATTKQEGAAAEGAATGDRFAKVLRQPGALPKHWRLKTKPTMNDLLCYCLSNAFAQVRDPQRMGYLLRLILNDSGAAGNEDERLNGHDAGSLPTNDDRLTPRRRLRLLERNKSLFESQDGQEFVNVIVPMMCRVSIPTRMDNFTSLVPTRLPLPVPRWRQRQRSTQWEEQVDAVMRVHSIKAVLDQMKAQNCRTTLFLIFCAICKALPSSWTEKFYFEVYRHMQFCSTNVAAPSIDSTFCGKKVHGLFFWPAVPCSSTGGSAWVSLGEEMQVLTVLDEAELQAATREATQMVEEMYPGLCVGAEAKTHLIEELADILPKLVLEEFNRLCDIFEVDHPPRRARRREDLNAKTAVTTTAAPPESQRGENAAKGQGQADLTIAADSVRFNLSEEQKHQVSAGARKVDTDDQMLANETRAASRA